MFNFIYQNSLKLGHAIGFGALEGFILYASVIMLGITTVINKKGDKK
jgi:hypothetical protein